MPRPPALARSHASIRYVTTRDGYRLAWTALGSGSPTLVRVGGWLTHLLMDTGDSPTGGFVQQQASRKRLVIYDRPGMGLSDRLSREFSFEDQLDHLERVLDAAREERVALFARPFGGPVAIAFAATRPERVSHLVLFGTGARLVRSPDFPEGVDPAVAAAVVSLVEAQWELASRTISNLMMPSAGAELERWYADYMLSAADPGTIAKLIDVQLSLDATEFLPHVQAPTLILHRRDDRVLSAGSADRLAAELPNARVQILQGAATLPFAEDTQAVADRIDEFLSSDGLLRVVGLQRKLSDLHEDLSRREHEVADLVASGLRNREIAARLHVSERTVESHVGNALAKMGFTSRSQLAAWAAGQNPDWERARNGFVR